MEMNKKIVIWIAVIVLVVIGVYYLISPLFNTIESNEGMRFAQVSSGDGTVETMESQLISSGDFVASAHSVEGQAKVLELDGQKYLRFENFETVNGPNLHIYLSSDLNANDFIDLGPIKATKGSANYDLPEGVDLEKYDKVLVWCVPFKVKFSYAELS